MQKHAFLAHFMIWKNNLDMRTINEKKKNTRMQILPSLITCVCMLRGGGTIL